MSGERWWENYHVFEDGTVHYPIGAIRRDLDRLAELAGPYREDGEDYGPAVVERIPDEAQRAEAAKLGERLAAQLEPHIDEINALFPDRGKGLRSV